MKHQILNPDQCRVHIIDPSGGVRATIKDVLKDMGYSDIQQFESVEDAAQAGIFAGDKIDWLITSLQSSAKTNFFHILTDFLHKPAAKGICITLMVERGEEEHLLTAFELGVINWLKKPITRDLVQTSLDRLIKRVEKHEHLPLVAAFELRTLLKKQNRFEELISLESKLFELYPSQELLINKAQAQLMAGHENEALMLLNDVERVDPGSRERIATLISEYNDNESIDDLIEIGFNLDHIVIIDPDETVYKSFRDIGTAMGALNVVHLKTAEEAIEWVKVNKKWLNDPNQLHLVISEWKMPDMAGNLFVQQLRLSGLQRPSLVIASSLLEKHDESILIEVGVSAVVAKPIERETALARLIGVLRSDVNPSNHIALQRKIKQLVRNDNIEEANRFLLDYCSNEMIPDGEKLKMQAELSFAKGFYEDCKDLVMRGVRLSRIDASAINLLGKCLMKLQDFDNASKCFQRAEELSPQNIDRKLNIALAEVNKGNTDFADSILDEVDEWGVDKDIIDPVRAKVAVSQGAPMPSEDIWENEESSASIAAFINNQAVVYARSGELEKSIETYIKALETIPQSQAQMRGVIQYNLGLAWVRCGDLVGASEALLPSASVENPAEKQREKSATLLETVRNAAKNGIKINVSSSGVDEVSVTSPDERAQLEFFMKESSLNPGDFCLFGIFKSSFIIPEDTLKIMVKKKAIA